MRWGTVCSKMDESIHGWNYVDDETAREIEKFVRKLDEKQRMESIKVAGRMGYEHFRSRQPKAVFVHPSMSLCANFGDGNLAVFTLQYNDNVV